ncbi:MAG TPA: hypothetical protein VN873_03420 [Candidatus Angelobacter sp.]|nr:hypothetical protein [Candidatus Angelobacter sp.]
MKTFLANSARCLGLAAAALLAQTAPVLAAQPTSPVGQWDCLMNGNGQNGILFLNFTADIDPVTGLPTFEGILAQAGHKGFKSGSDGRPGGGGTGTRGSGADFTSVTNIFGGGFIDGGAGEVADNGGPGDWLADSRGHRGTWFFNSKGQVVGSFFIVLNASGVVTNFLETCVDEVLTVPLTNGGVFNQQVQFCFTNPVFATNILWGPASDGEVGVTNLTFTNNNFFVSTIGVNQNISFVGKVHGNRLTMLASGPAGKFTITGVPLQPVNTALPVDGFFWTATQRADGAQTQEQFFLSDTAIPNYFGLNGQGPSYSYNFTNSFCLISQQRRIAFVFDEIPGIEGSGPDNLRATVGKFINTSKVIGSDTIGIGSAQSSIVQFNARLTPFSAP